MASWQLLIVEVVVELVEVPSSTNKKRYEPSLYYPIVTRLHCLTSSIVLLPQFGRPELVDQNRDVDSFFRTLARRLPLHPASCSGSWLCGDAVGTSLYPILFSHYRGFYFLTAVAFIEIV